MEQPGGGIGLWLEKILEAPEGDWPLSRYALAARHLGRFSGVYLIGRPLPSYSWLIHHPFRDQFAGENELREFIASASTWAPSAMRGAFRRPVAGALLRLWEEHALFLDALDRLPQTLCHDDACRANLISRLTSGGEEETVASRTLSSAR